jgi:NitT/TauT family transport system substrate-binding protein
MTMRRNFLANVGLAGFGLAAGGLMTRQGLAQSSAKPLVLKSAVPSLTTAVQLTMLAQQFDKKHSITVDMQASGTSSTLIVDAVINGIADFGSPGTADAMQAIRAGAPLKIVAAVCNNLQTMVIGNEALKRVGVSPNAPIADRIRALKGLTVATGAVGSTHFQILRAYLKQYGVDPDRDLRLIGLGEASALISGLENGRFDAIAYASGVVELAVASGVGTIWISGPRGEISKDEVKTCVIVAHADTVDKRRAEVDALRDALTDALQAINQDHAATGALLQHAYFQKLDPKVWELAWGATTSSYPTTLAFSHAAFDYWAQNDPKGAATYKDVDYTKVTYAPAQQA